MEAKRNDNLVMENNTVEVLYVEMGAENQTLPDMQLSSVKRRPTKTRSIVYKFFNWEEETQQWSCIICTYVEKCFRSLCFGYYRFV